MDNAKGLTTLTACGLDQLYTRNEVSPVEVLKATLDRCAEVNPKVNAVILVDEDGAMLAARASESRQRVGKRLSSFDGVPYTVKDNLWVGGLKATWGSRLYRDFVAPHDDIPVERMKRAGAVMIGKTNTPECALSNRTDNRVFGLTRNPWNLALTPGGSSGGAVAAVACGIGPIAIGTDAGGSTRVPASYTGLYGLRPSTGAIPRCHGFPATVVDFQAIGLISRTVDDLTGLFGQLAGPDACDPGSLRFSHARHGGVDGDVRIRLLDRIGDEPVHPEVRAAVRAAAESFAKLGCEVVEGQAPYDLDELREIWAVLSSVGAARIAIRHANWENELTADLLGIAKAGLQRTGVEYLSALDRLAAFRAEVVRRWTGFQILLTPTSATLPWSVEEPYAKTIDGKPANPRSPSIFSTWVNAATLPGLNVPVGRSHGGVPIGVQLVGPYGHDEVLLNLAARYATAHPESTGWPKI